MQEFRVYRNVNIPIKFLGLELLDVGILVAVFIVVFDVSDHIILNGVLMVVVFGAFRWMKRGRPPRYVTQLILFLLSPLSRQVSLNDRLKRYPAREG
jgi:hypothetical protein